MCFSEYDSTGGAEVWGGKNQTRYQYSPNWNFQVWKVSMNEQLWCVQDSLVLMNNIANNTDSITLISCAQGSHWEANALMVDY